MPARHRAEVRFDAGSDAAAHAIATAVSVESLDGPGGSLTTWATEGATVLCRVEAQEAGSLRAALTGALRLADAAARTLGA